MTTGIETFGNPWFCVSFHWQDGMLTGIDLENPGRTTTEPCSPHGPALAKLIAAYDTASDDMWPDLPLAMRNLPPFRGAVLDWLRRNVHRGSVITYAQLATACGSPRAARAVGTAMATNPWPLLIPCHRVLAGHGLGGFGPGLPLKITLLTLEGAPVPA